MGDLTLVIGNKSYSSWSLRPWLALKQAGARFDEVVIPLHRPDTKAEILKHSAAGKIPVLHHGDITVWESLAICEYVADLFPEAGLWPEDRARRAVCRSVATEMHGGFAALRQALPMNLRQQGLSRPRTPEAKADIARVTGLWRDLRGRFGEGGPFLFGRFSIADAMYAPVCTRFATYGVDLDPVSAAYVDAVLALPSMQEWTDAARAEPWVIDL